MDTSDIKLSVAHYHIYVDSACSKDGSPDAIASIGVWVEEVPDASVSESVPPYYNQTNQVAELLSMLKAVG